MRFLVDISIELIHVYISYMAIEVARCLVNLEIIYEESITSSKILVNISEHPHTL